MTMQIMDAGGILRTISDMTVKDTGTSRDIRTMKVMDVDGTTLRTVATFAIPLTGVVLSEDFVVGLGSSSPVTSSSTVATPTGGLGPFTYAWVRLTGTATANSPTAASTSFTSAALIPGQTTISTFRVTATDSIGATATADCTVTLERLL